MKVNIATKSLIFIVQTIESKNKIILGTPQENGVLERINMNTLDCARCMRLPAGLPF